MGETLRPYTYNRPATVLFETLWRRTQASGGTTEMRQ